MSTGESLYFLSFRKKGAEYVLSTKEERQKKYRQSDDSILLKKIGSLERVNFKYIFYSFKQIALMIFSLYY